MSTFKRINNITGWIIFAISSGIYLLTMEPTVSLWDCGEFISAAYKLEVGHPPGAPFYLMLGRIFSLFAVDQSNVAACVNALSALSSAFTILFLFWTITHLARKIVVKAGEAISGYQIKLIIGSGIVGALSFCFSDSFWFSATEAEVYALSSLFTAFVFWAILKWEEDSGSHSNRWLVLIAYMMGLSIGIHLLNLLAIPALGLVFYFRRYKPTIKGAWIALSISFVLLLVVLYLVIPGTVKVASVVELIAVNSFHMPVNSGLVIFMLFAVFSLLFLSWYTHKKNKVLANISILFLTVILIGYSSYSMIVIRAQVNPPINTGNPSNVYSLLSYLNRDQYGDRPLLYGPYFNAPVKQSNSKTISFKEVNGKYEETTGKNSRVYDEQFLTVFPRMYSPNANHILVYKDWGTINGTPTFIDNLEFFFKYQVGYMYLRYFMWNFAGKQNDMQGNGGIMKGNWISGFDFVDQWMIGPQKTLPDYLKNNPGRNQYFLLPLLLGLAGMIFHFSRSRRYFAVVTLLFLFTGLAIVLYTNQPPLQPRERDYVYVGSFYAFCIWIGLGVLWLVNILKKYLSIKKAVVLGIATSLLVPVIMFAQNLDDHNRHGRYTVRDIAVNYLKSCDKDAILFTVGDNDTYPLWYLQEVEGVRTDVRVVNLMLLNASWYIDQQKVKVYNSEALPVEASAGKRNVVYLHESDTAIFVGDAMKIISGENTFLPTKNMKLPINNNPIEDLDVPESVSFKIPGNYLGKSEMVVLDILSNFDWNRPVYFNTPGYKGTIGLDNYFQLEGFAYRLVPSFTEIPDYGKIETDELYKTLMDSVQWSDNSNVLIDDHIRTMFAIMKVRQNYARLSMALAKENEYAKAEVVLDKVMKVMPTSKFPYDHYCISIAEAYHRCGAHKKANNILMGYENQLQQELNYYTQLKPWMKSWTKKEQSQTIFYLEKVRMLKDSLNRKKL